MAQRNEILNKDLLKRLAARLNMGGVRQYPFKLNTDEVQCVINLGDIDAPTPTPPQLGTVTLEYQNDPAVNLAAITLLDFFSMQTTPDEWTQMLAFGVRATGPIVGASSPIGLRFAYAPVPAATPFYPVIDLQEAGFTSTSAAWDMTFALNGRSYPNTTSRQSQESHTWPGLIPPNSLFYARITNTLGFPVGANLEWYAHWIHWPVGTVKPF